VRSTAGEMNRRRNFVGARAARHIREAKTGLIAAAWTKAEQHARRKAAKATQVAQYRAPHRRGQWRSRPPDRLERITSSTTSRIPTPISC
jgi:hypothetical protein